jgi:hypothetical protein
MTDHETDQTDHDLPLLDAESEALRRLGYVVGPSNRAIRELSKLDTRAFAALRLGVQRADTRCCTR